MKIKQRLIVAFLTTLIMPVVLVICAASVIMMIQSKKICETYDVSGVLGTEEMLANPMGLLNAMTEDAYNETKILALKDPTRLEDLDYLKRIQKSFEGRSSYVILRKQNQIKYSGNETSVKLIEKHLPKFGEYKGNFGVYMSEGVPALIKQQDFYGANGEEESIFFVTELTQILPEIKKSVNQFIISFFVIIIFTDALLMLWIYGGIVRPLNILRIATNQMGKGNLDYAFEIDKDNEIGELSKDFEKMRGRLKRLIESRLEYEEDIRELISNVSHDLKTPLTTIKGYTEGLLDGIADTPEKQEKYLQTILAKANAVTALVDELSVYAKIDSDTAAYNFTGVDILAYLEDCVGEYESEVEEKGMTITMENTMKRSYKVIMDPEKLKRVMDNIIINSMKYMDKENGKITVRLHDGTDFVRVEVKDNGPGIKKEEENTIFDRFYRADASRSSSTGGSGLGLAISRKIVQEHGGDIWAKSEPGNGLSISFTLNKKIEEKKLPKPENKIPKEEREIREMMEEVRRNADKDIAQNAEWRKL
ncbi:MAG: HAMP domain-containing histidine kinase [Lachnospiraceae bacterium]|nr:HAMP domain-containing histidine kinase [Lachnospiraceae bacterium]